MRDATLCFLIKKDGDEIKEICLGMKKRGFGVNRWNGVGGKVNAHEGETIEEALVRETQEEIGVKINDFYKVAELSFNFPDNKEWDQVVHTYFTEDWEGEPIESEEMRPEWFHVSKIPFDSMWPDDKHWLPHAINQRIIKGNFSFGENDVILNQNIEFVENLS